MPFASEKQNAHNTIQKLVERMNTSLQEVEPVRLLLTVLRETLKEKLQSDRTAVSNALFTELLKEEVNWDAWKGERFANDVLESWRVLKQHNFLDSAVPGPDEVDEDIIEPVLEALVSLLGAVDEPSSHAAKMELLVAKWKLRRTRDKDKVRAAVVGVESCGKSTMINNLIGTQALPTDAGMGTNSVMWVRSAKRVSVTKDKEPPLYPSNLQECLKQLLEDPAEEVLKIESPWSISLGSVDLLDVPGLKVSKTSFTFQDNTAKHSAIAMAMCDVVVLVARDAETLRGQLSNPNLLQNLPSWAGDKPVICCVTRSDPAKFEEQRGDLAKIMTQFFPNSKATEVVFCNFMFSPEFKEGRDHLTQLFKMKPRRPDVKVIWRDVYRTVLKTVKTIEQKFSPLEKQFEQQFHAIWGPFKDRLNNMYHDGGDADSEEKEREELRKIMTQALAATGFEAGLQATVDRMQPLQLGLFKKQDDFDRGYIHICWNLIGEVRKAVFNAIDFLGLELWRRYILKGLDALVDELRIDKVKDKVVVSVAHKLLSVDASREQTLRDRNLYASSSIVDLCTEKTFRNLFTGFYFVLLDPPCAYDIMEYSPGGKVYWKAYVEPCQRMFDEFTSDKYPPALSDEVDKSAEGAFEAMRDQMLKEVGNVASFLANCPVLPRKGASTDEYSSMVMYVILHIFIGFLYRSVCNNLGENSATLTDLGVLLQSKAGETPFAQSVEMLRGDIPTAQSTSSEIREFYQTCRSILNHLRDGKSGENHKPTLDSIKKVLDEVATFCNLLFEPSSHTPGQKIVLFSACNSLHEKGRNMDMQKSVVALLNSYIDNPKDNLKLVYDGDDPQTDAYCAAVILRSTYDQDTADLSAREKDILKRIEGFGSVARVFVLMPDTPDDNVGRFIAAPPHKDDPFQRVQRMILSPHDAQADAAKSSGGAPSSVPQYIKLGVHSVQIVDPQVLQTDQIALVIKTDSPEFIEAFADGMKASKENPKPAGEHSGGCCLGGPGLGVEWHTDYILPLHGAQNELTVELTLLRENVGSVTFGTFQVRLTVERLAAMAKGQKFSGKMLRGGATVGHFRCDISVITPDDLTNVDSLRPKKGRAEAWLRKALEAAGPEIDEQAPGGAFLAQMVRIQREGLGPRLVKENVGALKKNVCERLEEAALRLDNRDLICIGPDLKGQTIEEAIFDAYDKALKNMDEKAKTLQCSLSEQMPKWFQFSEAHIDKLVEKTPTLAGVRIAGFPELWARMNMLVYSEVALVHMTESMSTDCWHGLFEPELAELAELFGVDRAVLVAELVKSDEQRLKVLVDEQAFVAMVVGFAMMFSITYIAWQVFAKFNTPAVKYKQEFAQIHVDANSRFTKLYESS